MREEANADSKKAKPKRHGGLLRHFNRPVRVFTALVLAVACAALAFTQLGFAGFGWGGEYSAYLILELLPVAVAALLLGPLVGMCMGAFAGAMLFAHAALMPLNYYEYTFVTPLTSAAMMGVTGLMLGLLFRFVLRNDPSFLKSSIYITIVCIVVSWLYSIGFIFNAIASMVFAISSADSSLPYEEISKAIRDRASSYVLRMGNMGLQAWIDAALMSVSCIVALAMVAKAERAMGKRGLRSTFAVPLSAVVVVVFMITSALSFVSITQGEIGDAKQDMRSEINYLGKQIDNIDKRSDALYNWVVNSADISDLSQEQFIAMSDVSSVDDMLDGYAREDDGTILIMLPTKDNGGSNTGLVKDDYLIVASDDERFKAGSLLSTIAGDEVVAAVKESDQKSDITRVVYDEDFGKDFLTLEQEGIDKVRSEIVYMLVQEKNDYAVVIIYPSSKVFVARAGIMGWTTLSVFVLLVVIFAMVFLLLNRVIVRRIDETNDTLARITAGDLDAKAHVRDTLEFASLSDGVNTTVDALKGWIAEAESRMDAELATAKAIQESALPRVFPPYPDILKFDIYASMNAAREVGGDFYDIFLVGDESDADTGKLGFVIADVSGKGVPAALFMMKAMTQLRDYLKVGMEVGEAVENANRQLCEGNDEGMFVTVWAGVLDYATGHIDYVNAGHNPPLLWQKENGWNWLEDRSGLPLGLFDGLPYEAFSVECGVGDEFLLYTDGVTEAMSVDGELYGEERLEKFVRNNYTLHPRMLVSALRSDVANWAKGAEQSDDITVLALEVGVPPELTATLKLPAIVENLPQVNEFIHSELDRRLCPKRVQNQLDIAVEELFVNVCHYAYPDATPENPGTVRILRTYSAEPPSVVVDIVDKGVPYDPLAKPDAVTPDNIEDVPIGGLGILMAKRCTDAMSYERSGDSNIVTILKKW